MSAELSGISSAGLAAQGLLTRTGTGGALTSSQLMPKAKEFESILLTQWLQGAETSFGSVPGGDEDQDAGDEQMKDFAVQQLAKAFSDAGGIGIASMVTRALGKESTPTAPQTDTNAR